METLTGMEKGLETAIGVENGLLRRAHGVPDRRTHFLELAVATRIRQAYGGALACENVYEDAITFRIHGSDRKTITCWGNQRQQRPSWPTGSRPMPTCLVGRFRVTEGHWRVKTLTSVQ